MLLDYVDDVERSNQPKNELTYKHNCKVDTVRREKGLLCEKSARQKPMKGIKKGRNRGQLFRPYWDSSEHGITCEI